MVVCIATPALADVMATHRFSANGMHMPAGWPKDYTPKLLVLAGKPLRLHFDGIAADWQPGVYLHRVTSGRRVPLQADPAEPAANGLQWTWTPPTTRGPAHYEIRLEGRPARVVRVESRDPAWLKTTLETLTTMVDWDAQGLTADELAAITAHGLQLGRSSAGGGNGVASLQMIPRHGGGARRRVVWDKENPELVVWRPGPAAGDLEVRAPRWWISPEALAADHGLIRFLDLFSEPPPSP
ncbi:MAG: hypothetical protein MUF86_11055 [Akkermansiaceae bacterium]|jgi:hypothetical protein|nr:hypothetical protein [Akkermansiaceae bacterium]